MFMAWYAVVRLALETLRTGNWTFFGVPTAIVVSSVVIVGSLVVLAYRHRSGAADADRWGDAPPAADDEDGEWIEVDEPDDPGARRVSEDTADGGDGGTDGTGAGDDGDDGGGDGDDRSDGGGDAG
jgi:hypothetical protein